MDSPKSPDSPPSVGTPASMGEVAVDEDSSSTVPNLQVTARTPPPNPLQREEEGAGEEHPAVLREETLGGPKAKKASGSNLLVSSNIDGSYSNVGAEYSIMTDTSLSQMVSGRELIPEIIQASLSGLGHNREGRVIYTTCSLSSLSLCGIDAMSGYKFLQKILLDANYLESLKPLEGLDSLCYVSAHSNKLTSDVLDHLSASAETLEYLDISGNQITQIEQLPLFRYLRTFKADGNLLTEVKAADFSNARSLSVLSLGNNRIATIEGTAFRSSPIRSLNVRSNTLADLNAILPLKNTLSSLVVANNNVMHFDVLTPMLKLHTLDLSDNNAYEIGEVHALAKLPLLRTLSLQGNPLCQLHDRNLTVDDDDDAASDIVQPDEPAAGDEGNVNGVPRDVDEEKLGSSTTPTKLITGNDDLKPRTITNRAKRQGAEVSSVQMFVSEDDKIAMLNPQEEDKIQFLTADSESQYRLRVLWRAPNITQLDSKDVTAEELGHAKKLEGGATRETRASTRTKFLTSGGSAAFALRQHNRHRDAPNM